MAKKYKPETIKKDFNILSFIMQHAAENGLCKTNPANQSIHLPRIERSEKIAYTQQQYDVVYNFARHSPNALSIMLMLETGISRSELLGLKWDDLNLDEGVIHINQGLVAYTDLDNKSWTVESSSLKNEYRRRDIPILDSELLKRLAEKPRTLKLRTKDGISYTVTPEHVFHSPKGVPYQPNNWNNLVFIPFMKSLHEAHPEIPILSAHELRHTRATLWVAQGVAPLMVARLLGHSDTKMLIKVYDHTDVATLRKALSKAQGV